MSELVAYHTIKTPATEKTVAALCHSQYKFECPLCKSKAKLTYDSMNNRLIIEHDCDHALSARRDFNGDYIVMAVQPARTVII